jgi:hypothetical protein
MCLFEFSRSINLLCKRNILFANMVKIPATIFMACYETFGESCISILNISFLLSVDGDDRRVGTWKFRRNRRGTSIYSKIHAGTTAHTGCAASLPPCLISLALSTPSMPHLSRSIDSGEVTRPAVVRRRLTSGGCA